MFRIPLPFHAALLAGATLALAGAGHAAPISPIKLDKLLTGKGQWRTDATLLYAPGYLTTAGIGAGQNLPIATDVQGLDINTFALNLGLSYGLGNGTEISLGTSQSYNRTVNTLPPYGKDSASSWDGLSVGISKELYSNTKEKLVLIGSASLDLARPVQLPSGERHRASARSGTLGLALNKVIDPLVLSLSATYAHGVSGSFDGQSVKEPSVWSLSPSISFQVNERIGLGWGAQFSRIGERHVDLGLGGGPLRVGAQSQTSFLFSMNYQLGKDSALVASYSFPTLQNAAPVFSLRYLADLDL